MTQVKITTLINHHLTASFSLYKVDATALVVGIHINKLR